MIRRITTAAKDPAMLRDLLWTTAGIVALFVVKMVVGYYLYQRSMNKIKSFVQSAVPAVSKDRSTAAADVGLASKSPSVVPNGCTSTAEFKCRVECCADPSHPTARRCRLVCGSF